MLIATTVVAALLTSSALLEAPRPSDPPPLAISVVTTTEVSPQLVSRVLDEARAIWQAAGLTIVSRTAPSAHATLRVTIGDAPGSAPDGLMPLGWIVFDDDRAPEQEIYVSYANAEALLDHSAGVVGPVSVMPRLLRETLLGRAMGRALAHELGHYLLASKVHSARGLMQASRSAFELFRADRARFGLGAAERRQVASRLQALHAARRDTDGVLF